MIYAPFACDPAATRGRQFDEQEDGIRSPFQRDRDRIIHSTAFRRLEYKTQVFVNHEGDHYRTRLTHTLEVAQIARTIARALGIDEDLTETVALAHDLGHPPFGHAGEDALHACMLPYGGFDHNEQTLRIVTKLENRYAKFDGLNLTWETLEGIVKHNGPVQFNGSKQAHAGKSRTYTQSFITQFDLEVEGYASLEAQVAALADDIAYNNHDLDDGLRAGLFNERDLLTIPVIGDIVLEMQDRYPDLSIVKRRNEVIRRLVRVMVTDLLQETKERLSTVKNVLDVRNAVQATAAFSDGMQRVIEALRIFLFKRMYRHSSVNRMAAKADVLVGDLFNRFMEHPECLPEEWQMDLPGSTDGDAQHIANYIAGMTDRYAQKEHKKMFDLYG